MPANAAGETVSTSAARDDRAAIDKAVSILAAFGADVERSLGGSELARRADLCKSTAFRVLRTLERNGLVERAAGRYRLGTRLQEIVVSSAAPDNCRTRDVLTPFMADLYELTHETVHLAVLRGTDVVYLNKLYGHRQVPAPSTIGGTVPAYCTAVGKALLAYDADALDSTLALELRAWTPNTINDAEVLRRSLADARRQGIAFDDQEARVGLSCVAVPVLGPQGQPVAAFSVAGATQRFDPRAHAPALRRVGMAAARALAVARRTDRARAAERMLAGSAAGRGPEAAVGREVA